MERKDRTQGDHATAPGRPAPQRTGEERGDRERFATMLDPTNQFLTLRYLLPEEPEEQRNEPNVEEAA